MENNCLIIRVEPDDEDGMSKSETETDTKDNKDVKDDSSEESDTKDNNDVKEGGDEESDTKDNNDIKEDSGEESDTKDNKDVKEDSGEESDTKDNKDVKEDSGEESDTKDNKDVKEEDGGKKTTWSTKDQDALELLRRLNSNPMGFKIDSDKLMELEKRKAEFDKEIQLNARDIDTKGKLTLKVQTETGYISMGFYFNPQHTFKDIAKSIKDYNGMEVGEAWGH
eukprot:s4177_g7.t1